MRNNSCQRLALVFRMLLAKPTLNISDSLVKNLLQNLGVLELFLNLADN